jgi:hypothetical protein
VNSSGVFRLPSGVSSLLWSLDSAHDSRLFPFPVQTGGCLRFLLFSSELGTFCGCLAFGEPTKSIRERKRHSGKKCDRKPHSTNLKKSRIFEKRPENRRGILQPNSSRPAPLYFLQSLLFFAFDSVKNHLLCPNRADESQGGGSLLEIEGGATCDRAHTIEGQREGVPLFRLAPLPSVLAT